MTNEIEIRECSRVEELARCVELQRSVFRLPELEISPVRHLIVTRSAGGFTLGAYSDGELIGFVLSVPAFLRGEPAFYSHMTAVREDFQGTGIGAKLKWAQRERALQLGVRSIKWTFEPVKARNAYFNLEKLGAIVHEYQEDFYGTDYATTPGIGLASDRLFAEWHLESEKVTALSQAEEYEEMREPALEIEVPPSWASLVKQDPRNALSVQLQIREDFVQAFGKGFVCRGFRRDELRPSYTLFED